MAGEGGERREGKGREGKEGVRRRRGEKKRRAAKGGEGRKGVRRGGKGKGRERKERGGARACPPTHNFWVRHWHRQKHRLSATLYTTAC